MKSEKDKMKNEHVIENGYGMLDASPLKPCPFCGARPLFWEIPPLTSEIICENKRCRVRPHVCETSPKRAIAVWNRRKGEK